MDLSSVQSTSVYLSNILVDNQMSTTNGVQFKVLGDSTVANVNFQIDSESKFQNLKNSNNVHACLYELRAAVFLDINS